jgi:hypothetical protein
MTEYSRMAKGHFTSTGAAKMINLPFQPDAVELYNYTASATPANHGIPFAYWDADMGQGFAIVDLFNATPVGTTGVVTSNGISSFSAGLALQYGPQLQISGITKANPAVVTTASPHGLSTGQVVILEGLFQSATTGMPQISLMPFVVTVTGATTFTIAWNTNQSNYTALSASPTGAFVRQVLYPMLYEPGVAFISAITTGTTTTVTTTDPHDFVVGQEIGFRIPAAYGTTQLNELPNNTIPGSPVYYYVTAINSNTQFVCNANSTGFTAFATNQTVAQMVGQSLPQVVAVGDVNSGGVAYSGGALYPSPAFPTFSGGVPTINGPAIAGAFVNNTSQGFIIGAGAAASDASSVLVGANADVIYWRAMLHDMDVF